MPRAPASHPKGSTHIGSHTEEHTHIGAHTHRRRTTAHASSRGSQRVLVCLPRAGAVGLRFFWIPIHPLKIGATLMNSFLFNVWLLLLCAVACVQFCFAAFQSYAQLTAIDMLLGVQVRNLIGLSSFFANNVFFYTMFSISALTLLYLCAFPKDKRALEDD